MSDTRDERDDMMLAGEYFLAVEGLAMIRHTVVDPTRLHARVAEVRSIIERFGEFPNSLEIPVAEHDVQSGYAKWAPNYDGPNPAVEYEEPVVHRFLDALPPGDALDAACGTGRHAGELARRGHRVIGVDASDAMLRLARQKSPDVDFRNGSLDALPLDDASVDLVTCALALTHVSDLAPAMREFARVLRPGGTLITSDIHPITTMTGGVAAFPPDDGERRARTDAAALGIRYVPNLTHHLGDYVAAFTAAGLTIVDCAEPRIDEHLATSGPGYAAIPEATREAFIGLPYLVIWRAKRPA